MTGHPQQLVLVRHGETVGQSSIRLYGSTDVALAPEGEAQLAATGRSLAGRRFDAVFTSPLCRARRSAEVMLESLGHPSIAIEEVPGFREIDFGAWEGWTWDEVRERDPENHARWAREGASFCFPGGEVRAEFVERVQLATGPTIEARFAAGAGAILAVVHKGVIKAIAARMLGRPVLELAGFDLPLGAVRFLRRQDGLWTVDQTQIETFEPVHRSPTERS
ncbi:MAG: histidine phosphatase family protein [Enhygromyxa sp.]